MQLFSSVNSFFQALESEPLHLEAPQVGKGWIWDSSQNAIATRLHLVRQIPQEPVWIPETSKHGGKRTYGEGQRWESISFTD